MPSSPFTVDVETVVGPLLDNLGFVLDDVDDSPDQGGIERHIVYYQSKDCRLQIYGSSREGEINCMIAPLDASSQFGLAGKNGILLVDFRSDRICRPRKCFGKR